MREGLKKLSKTFDKQLYIQYINPTRGWTWILLDHLERQNSLNETKDIIRSKIQQSIVGNITPIIWFGKNKNYIA